MTTSAVTLCQGSGERSPMKLAITGYGRMGHEIERAAIARGHEVVCRIDPHVPEADVANVAAAQRAGMLVAGGLRDRFCPPRRGG